MKLEEISQEVWDFNVKIYNKLKSENLNLFLFQETPIQEIPLLGIKVHLQRVEASTMEIFKPLKVSIPSLKEEDQFFNYNKIKSKSCTIFLFLEEILAKQKIFLKSLNLEWFILGDGTLILCSIFNQSSFSCACYLEENLRLDEKILNQLDLQSEVDIFKALDREL
jgi:hypothetical protein